jgi:hypothetical protein
MEGLGSAERLDLAPHHKHPEVRKWLARHPHWAFSPRLSKRRLKLGVFRSVVDVQAAITASSTTATLTANPSNGSPTTATLSPQSDARAKR